jgi:hypothetical protein
MIFRAVSKDPGGFEGSDPGGFEGSTILADAAFGFEGSAFGFEGSTILADAFEVSVGGAPRDPTVL